MKTSRRRRSRGDREALRLIALAQRDPFPEIPGVGDAFRRVRFFALQDMRPNDRHNADKFALWLLAAALYEDTLTEGRYPISPVAGFTACVLRVGQECGLPWRFVRAQARRAATGWR